MDKPRIYLDNCCFNRPFDDPAQLPGSKYLDRVPDSPYTDKPLRYIKRQNDVLIASDDEHLLDGSEEEVEQLIAEAQPGSRVFPGGALHFIFVVTKR